MPPKKTGLVAFTGSQESPSQRQETVPDTLRTKAKGETVSLTLRLSRDQWERAHQLARAEGVSLNRLALLALSKLFQEKGLPDL